ncbi:MAG: hypothetical protein OXN89_05760 [Bryobacterales bacterium]|nr:hypothetical protein [Bryobacterales bacterium]
MFLTLEDPRARVKGSRDPLGVQPIWTAFGRRVIANLVTVTDSLRGFTVLMLGRYFGERLLTAGKVREADVIDVFLRVEQVCGYARCLALEEDVVRKSGRILGIERIRRRIAKRPEPARIGVTPDAMILSDQKTYGLWGLFSASARVSKLIPDGPVGLCADAERLVRETYLPNLQPVLNRLEDLFARGGTLRLEARPNALLALLGQVLGAPASRSERRFYRRHLCDGDHCTQLPSGRQATFRQLLESHSDLTRQVNRDELASIRRAAQREDAGLATRIGRILALEALLAPSEALFRFVQTRHGQSPSDVEATLVERWGRSVPHLVPREFREISDEIAQVAGGDVRAHMAGVHEALTKGQYSAAVKHLLEWNRLVMLRRSASPWVQLDHRNAIDVRYRGIERQLPTHEALPSLWDNGYFINTLKALVAQSAETPTERAA